MVSLRGDSISLKFLLFFGCFALAWKQPSAASDGENRTFSDLNQFRGKLQLPKFAVPLRYDLRLKPDLNESRFNGSVKINVDIVSDTAFLVLNLVALNITPGSVQYRVSESKVLEPNGTRLFEEDGIVVLEFAEKLPFGVGILSIEFQGILNDNSRAFFRSSYGPGGLEGNLAATHFEPIDARRMFPCWDEPALKATFKITLDVPSDLLALSNMPVAEEKVHGNIKTIIHQESPRMSTYLVAVAVGSFDFVEAHTSDGIKVRVYCPVGKSTEGQFALSVAIKSLDVFKDFFGVPYALPKLDLIGIPGYGGAMENYGLIAFDPRLLYVNEDSKANDILEVAGVLTHELSHQWTGDFVTMDWWTHLWLNEGFAQWLGPYALSKLFPEWEAWTQFLMSSALPVDSRTDSHPIELRINKTRDIGQTFDGITYNKGSDVLRMLQSYLGPETFQRSMASYIQEYAWSNANTDDFWAAISRASGMPVSYVMSGWTRQQGYPIISVKADSEKLELKQTQFFSAGSHGNGQWIVPITLCCGSYDTCQNTLLTKKSQTIDITKIEGCSCSKDGGCPWIKLNIEQTGFYRVKYDEELGSRLRYAIEEQYLSASDRYGLLDDMVAYSRAYQLPLANMLTLVGTYSEEQHYVVLSSMRTASNIVVKISADATPHLKNCIKKIFISIFEKSAQRLGWDSRKDDSFLDALMREDVLNSLALLGHDDTVQEATRRFRVYLNDRNTSMFPSNIRKAAYVAVMQNVTMQNQADYLSLLSLYKESNDTSDQFDILGSLTTCPDPHIVHQALDYMLTSGVPTFASLLSLDSLSWESREVAWVWLKENWETLSKLWGEYMYYAISRIVPLFASREAAAQVKEFFSNRTSLSFALALDQAIEMIYVDARWVQNIQKEQNLARVVRELSHGNC